MNDDWRARLADLRSATLRYDEAHQHEHRLYRIFKRLSGRIGDSRAYDLVGISLADRRSLRAYQAMAQARKAFCEVIHTAPTYARFIGGGVMPKSYMPWAANDRRPRVRIARTGGAL